MNFKSYRKNNDSFYNYFSKEVMVVELNSSTISKGTIFYQIYLASFWVSQNSTQKKNSEKYMILKVKLKRKRKRIE